MFVAYLLGVPYYYSPCLPSVFPWSVSTERNVSHYQFQIKKPIDLIRTGAKDVVSHDLSEICISQVLQVAWPLYKTFTKD